MRAGCFGPVCPFVRYLGHCGNNWTTRCSSTSPKARLSLAWGFKQIAAAFAPGTLKMTHPGGEMLQWDPMELAISFAVLTSVRAGQKPRSRGAEQ